MTERTWPYGNFVGGFLLNFELDSVILTEKHEPPWQAGLWTGITDNVLGSETPAEAIYRLFPVSVASRWRPFARVSGPDWVFNAFFALTYPSIKLPDGAHWIKLIDLDHIRTFGNVRWLVEMARSIAKMRDVCTFFEVHEK